MNRTTLILLLFIWSHEGNCLEISFQKINFIHPKSWTIHSTENTEMKPGYQLIKKNEYHCHHTVQSSAICSFCDAYVFLLNSNCAIGKLPEHKYLYRGHSEVGFKLFTEATSAPVEFSKHVLISYNGKLKDLNLLGTDLTLQLDFPDQPLDDLAVVYLPKNPTLYFCNPMPTLTASDKCWKLKVGAESYEQIPSLLWPVASGHFTSVFDDRLWLAGGTHDNLATKLDTSQLYNEKDDQWTEGPKLPIPVASGCLTPIGGNKFMLIGGFTEGTPVLSKLVFSFDWSNPSAGWTSLKDLPAKRNRPGCGMFEWSDGTPKMGVVGGARSNGAGGAERTLFYYDFETDEWESAPVPPHNVYRSGVIGMHGMKLWSMGGIQKTDSVVSDVIYEFDSVTQQWNEVGKLPEAASTPMPIYFNY